MAVERNTAEVPGRIELVDAACNWLDRVLEDKHLDNRYLRKAGLLRPGETRRQMLIRSLDLNDQRGDVILGAANLIMANLPGGDTLSDEEVRPYLVGLPSAVVLNIRKLVLEKDKLSVEEVISEEPADWREFRSMIASRSSQGNAAVFEQTKIQVIDPDKVDYSQVDSGVPYILGPDKPMWVLILGSSRSSCLAVSELANNIQITSKFLENPKWQLLLMGAAIGDEQMRLKKALYHHLELIEKEKTTQSDTDFETVGKFMNEAARTYVLSLLREEIYKNGQAILRTSYRDDTDKPPRYRLQRYVVSTETGGELRFQWLETDNEQLAREAAAKSGEDFMYRRVRTAWLKGWGKELDYGWYDEQSKSIVWGKELPSGDLKPLEQLIAKFGVVTYKEILMQGLGWQREADSNLNRLLACTSLDELFMVVRDLPAWGDGWPKEEILIERPILRFTAKASEPTAYKG